MTLIEYMKTSQDPLQSGVIETFARTSPILQDMPFIDIEGAALPYNREQRLPGIAFRGLNEAYDESTGVVNPQVEKLKIMGGDADTDRALMKWEKNFEERRATDLDMKAKAAALYFTKCFFDGDESSDPRQFDGLNARLTGNQVITAGADGANLDQNLLDRTIAAVKGTPDALYMGKKMQRQITHLFRNSSIMSDTKDAFGKQVLTYAGVPIHLIEEDNDDNEILAFDETQGSSVGVCGSLYAVRFGAREFICGLQTEPLNTRDLGELQTKACFRSRIEWYVSIAVFQVKSAARLKGITVITGVN
ncbi:MAG TPA: hypothetical protein ENN61_02985 [Bacteroidaceae bacterium]|nr:hypothetical protein [Bacteroidaceae bacterium]